MNRRRFLTVAAGFAAYPAFAATPLRWSGIALGAEARLELAAPEAIAGPALEAALGAIRRVERTFNLYDPGSELSRLNRTGRSDDPSADMRRIVALCDRLHRITGGAFDPTVQPMIAALKAGRDPETVRGATGWHRVDLDPLRLHAGQALTFNGIAQGYATDAVVAVLRDHGLLDAMVSVGEAAAMGRARRLGLVDPVHGMVGALTLRDAALATSSPMATPLGGSGHILHPKGTAPAWSTVSVEADSAAVADGMSTALCLLDAGAARSLRAAPGVRRIVLVDRDGDVRTL